MLIDGGGGGDGDVLGVLVLAWVYGVSAAVVILGGC